MQLYMQVCIQTTTTLSLSVVYNASGKQSQLACFLSVSVERTTDSIGGKFYKEYRAIVLINPLISTITFW